MKSNFFTVSATAIKIVEAQHFERTVYIHNKSGIIHIGNSTVTNAAGFPLKSDESIAIVVPINETIYAIDGVGGADVVVLDSSAE